jgi:hypothetical protein
VRFDGKADHLWPSVKPVDKDQQLDIHRLHRFTQTILFLARSRRGDPFLSWMIGSSIAPKMLNYMDLDHAATILTQGAFELLNL